MTGLNWIGQGKEDFREISFRRWLLYEPNCLLGLPMCEVLCRAIFHTIKRNPHNSPPCVELSLPSIQRQGNCAEKFKVQPSSTQNRTDARVWNQSLRTLTGKRCDPGPWWFQATQRREAMRRVPQAWYKVPLKRQDESQCPSTDKG